MWYEKVHMIDLVQEPNHTWLGRDTSTLLFWHNLMTLKRWHPAVDDIFRRVKRRSLDRKAF